VTAFRKALKERLHGRSRRRRWIYIPYDQLTDKVGPLAREDPRETGIVLVENPWKAARRPYHRQKLALVVANLRQFALEQAERGMDVRHFVANGPYRTALAAAARELGPMRVMRPAERELRHDLQPLFESGTLVQVPHEGWITSQADLLDSHPKGPPYLLERFYRAARLRYDVLMDGREPVGGRFNFDAENRHPWKPGDPEPPRMPSFPTDAVKQEVGDLIARNFARHPGRLDLDTLPTTARDAEQLWHCAALNCLPNFGRYEDAMSSQSSNLFHTRISALLNLLRLVPARVVHDTESLAIPIASKEGFIRQVLGWREFMHHVHDLTDGFRIAPAGSPVAEVPGDGGYAHWARQPCGCAMCRPMSRTGAHARPISAPRARCRPRTGAGRRGSTAWTALSKACGMRDGATTSHA
jgi:deoxyribodipyrimidine photolyase-related protein